jgi:hypothetical protein
MSQYPSPYSTPYPQQQPAGMGYGYDPAHTLRGPARRASVLMWVLGGLLLAGGACCGVVGSIPFGQIEMPAESRAQLEQLETQMQQLGLSFRTIFIGLGAASAAAGIALVVIAFFVRGAGMGGVVAGIVVTSMFTLALAVMTILGAIGMAGTRQPSAFLGLCLYLVPLALLVLLLVWLIQAARAAPAIRDLRAQQQSQYWQYQQQQAYYGQGGYGYSQPQQSPPQQPPPPPTSPPGADPGG